MGKSNSQSNSSSSSNSNSKSPTTTPIPESTHQSLLAAGKSALTTAISSLNPVYTEEKEIVTLDLKTDDDYKLAGELLVGLIKPGIKEAKNKLDPIVKSANDTHKRTVVLRAEVLYSWELANRIISKSMSEYDRKRKLLYQQLVTDRQEEDSKASHDSLTQSALELIEQGRDDEALALFANHSQEPAITPPDAIYRPVKVPGVINRTVKRFRVIDELQVRRSYLSLNLPAIQKVVDELGEDAEEVIGGIKVYEETIIGGRAQ